jgi:nucleoside phosphorylase
LLLINLRALLETENLISELEHGFKGKCRPSVPVDAVVGIFTSGSAVIADSQYLIQIEGIHRKVDALDMEVFALHRAAQLSIYNPPCICAKTVVDLCSAEKSDDIHLYGSYISAKFVLKAISNFFAKKEERSY